MLTRITINLKYIFSKFAIISSFVFGLVSIIQLFFDWNTIGIDSDNLKITEPAVDTTKTSNFD